MPLCFLQPGNRTENHALTHILTIGIFFNMAEIDEFVYIRRTQQIGGPANYEAGQYFAFLFGRMGKDLHI